MADTTTTATPAVARIKELLLDAHAKYEAAYEVGDRDQQMYFDGMIRGLRCAASSTEPRVGS